jgi:hypothetical protein
MDRRNPEQGGIHALASNGYVKGQTADMEGKALMNKFGPAYRNAGLPEGVKV